MNHLSFIAEELRKIDPMRFGATLAAAPQSRGRLWTLYALHHELSRLPFAVSETMLGELRLQWWQDQLTRLGEGQPATGHPTLEALALEWGADAGQLAGLADGHRRWFNPPPFAGAADVLAMIDATAGALMQRAAGVLAPDLDTVAALQGRGAGVLAFMRGWPALQAGGWVHDAADLADALLTDAQEAFTKARAQRHNVPARAAPALYAGAALGKTLRAARKDPGALPPQSEFRKRFGLARLAFTGRWWL